MELFEIQEARQDVHSCTGPACTFCQYLNGVAAKAKATKAVNIDPEWQERAVAWRRKIGIGTVFTADDLIAGIGHPMGSPNQVGALFRRWHGSSLIESLGYAKSTRKSNHARPVMIWKVTA
jgi:hypothetical protein